VRILRRIGFLSQYLVVLSVACMHTAAVRHADVIPLAKLKQPPLHLKVLRRAPILSLRDSKKVVAHVSPGQTLDVIGLGETEYSVKARTSVGQIAGWIAADALEAPPIELQEKLRQRRDLIDRHEVVVGMTRAEVRDCLGKPDRMARIRAASGDEERWFYTTYKYAPHFVQHQNEPGRSNQQLSYGRVPTGQRIIIFRRGEVVEIGEDEGMESKQSGNAAVAQPGQ
jgi:hypothetical protein